MAMVDLQDIAVAMLNKNKIALIVISAILILLFITNKVPTSYYKIKESKIYYFIDKNNNKIPVPDGFTVLNPDSEEKDGIVIIDNTNNITKGNEFVWVPTKEFKRINYNYSNLAYQNYNMNFVDKKEYSAIINSAKKYKGFYIARYEASKSEDKIMDVQVASSKLNKEPWVEIQYATNMNDIYGYSNGALKSAKYTYITNKNVNSTLTYPEHFDSIINWFLNSTNLKTESGIIIAKEDIITNSKKIGNYSGKIEMTGSNSDYCIKKICDLAGNVAEMTSESYFGNYHIVRGQKSLVYKRNLDAYTIHDWVGFRMVLII